jgi:hypothetical protein
MIEPTPIRHFLKVSEVLGGGRPPAPASPPQGQRAWEESETGGSLR